MARDIPETEWKEIQSRQAWRTERRQDKPNEVSSCLEKPEELWTFPRGKKEPLKCFNLKCCG